jgi:hypothetical protein
MAWVKFTKPIPRDRRSFIDGVWIPPTVIESWQKWFEDRGVRTRVELINRRWILYKWVDESTL